MRWAVTSATAVAAVAALGRGALLIARGRRRSRASGADPQDRMVASLRVAAGIRMLNVSALLLVLAAVGAYVLR